jgi:5-methylcytosine-specific restriction endonuclease McrA
MANSLTLWPRLCPVCSAEVVGHPNKRYCSKSCMRFAGRERNREAIREQYRAYYEANREAVLERVRAYREVNREAILAEKRAHYEANREKYREWGRAWRADNPEASRERARRYREANRETVLERQRAWVEANRERVREYARESKRAQIRANPEKYRELSARRRARKAKVTVEEVDRLKVFERDGWRCGICGGKTLRRAKWPHPKSAVLDHIIPLSRGGEHSMRNVQCAHNACNSAKHNRNCGSQLLLIG